MKRLASSLLLLLAALASQAQLLWKVSGNGLDKPSYITGTYHLAPASFADSIAGLKEAMADAEQVYCELDMTAMAKPEHAAKLQEAMTLPEGQTIDQLLNADEMGRLNALMKDVIGADMTNPMLAQQLGRFNPETIAMQLTVMMSLKKRPGFNPAEQYDTYFQQTALKENKAIGGLETIDEQIEALYKGKTPERQKQQLMCLADNREAYEKIADDLIEAFFAQDIEAVGKAVVAKINNSCDATAEELDALIYRRNANWAAKMPGIMKEKSTLFAVGAGHLPGKGGVIALLKDAGYTVEPVGKQLPR